MEPSKGSGFNLLPKETFKKREKERVKLDRVSVFSAVLPLIAVILWIIFILIGTLIQIQTREVTKEINQVDRQIASYKSIRDQKALLVLKTRSLGDVVQLDVNPEDFFNIVQNTIIESNLNITIKSYGRETTGDFFIDAYALSVKDVADLTRIFRVNPELGNVKLVGVSGGTQETDQTGAVFFTLVFNIEEKQSEQDGSIPE